MRHTIAFLFVVSWAVEGQALDYASACARPYRSGRRSPPPAPCDLAKHNFCTTPGNNYPWHAIRRFVRENQGLMKRMYGEERHIAVLKAEMENFIEEDEEDEFKRSSFDDDIMKTKMMYSNTHGRAMNVRPHFRPIQSTAAPPDRKKYDNDTLKIKPPQNKPSTIKTNTTIKDNKPDATNNNETSTDNKGISYKTKLESIANVEINSLDPDVITLEAVIKQSIESNSINTNISMGALKNEAANETVNIMERNISTTTEADNATEPVTTDEVATEEDATTTEGSKESWKPVLSDSSTLPPTLLFSEHEKVKNDRVEAVQADKTKEEFHHKPNHHQESVKPAVIKLRGANACESKEEMAAPFWANSTRGEVLALLNMYPFEQYIHLETCVHERKQMYCREGCRCEQQYRLHRLLAYDPRNECRGIFADWFKFPACCVCKCYDVPLEFRARSPRILRPQYDETLRRAILEDVAREWRASRYLDDEDDFY